MDHQLHVTDLSHTRGYVVQVAAEDSQHNVPKDHVIVIFVMIVDFYPMYFPNSHWFFLANRLVFLQFCFAFDPRLVWLNLGCLLFVS